MRPPAYSFAISTICRVIQVALSEKSYRVDAISDPGLMQAQLAAKPYHIVILDYVIPGLQADELLQCVNERQPEASIIVVTGYPSMDSALNCLRAGTHSHADPPNRDSQLLGGTTPSCTHRFWYSVTPGESTGRPLFHTYQSALGLLRELADSINHLCLSDVWFSTMSRMMRMLRCFAAACSLSKSASVPYCGSTVS